MSLNRPDFHHVCPSNSSSCVKKPILFRSYKSWNAHFTAPRIYSLTSCYRRWTQEMLSIRKCENPGIHQTLNTYIQLQLRQPNAYENSCECLCNSMMHLPIEQANLQTVGLGLGVRRGGSFRHSHVRHPSRQTPHYGSWAEHTAHCLSHCHCTPLATLRASPVHSSVFVHTNEWRIGGRGGFEDDIGGFGRETGEQRLLWAAARQQRGARCHGEE